MKNYSDKLVGFLAGAILMCATALGQNGGLRFTLTDLGVFGGTSSEAFAINDSGMVVGSYTVAGGKRCFILQNGAVLKFDGGTTPPKCEALAVDIKGNVAGRMYTPRSASVYRAFRYDNGGPLTVLDPRPGYNASMALGIRGGTVVGGIGNSFYGNYCDWCPFWYSGLEEAVYWDSSGVLTTIVSKQGGTFGNYARGINGRGEIVGRVFNFNSRSTPWLWKAGVLTYLALPVDPYWLPSPYGFADAINANGSIVGGGNFANGTQDGICAEMWSSRSPATQPILLPNCGYQDISANAVSNDNWVVGNSHDLPPRFPFLSVPDPNCVLTDLNTLLDASGRGWTLTTAYGINSQHWIVGAAISTRNGQLHAVLLTPNNSPLC
ncbi:MAG: hypothetical protein HY010_19920 [Acidobacteria bacterium]|nr:hypothetical protein [Acidobacteriota bacterium]